MKVVYTIYSGMYYCKADDSIFKPGACRRRVHNWFDEIAFVCNVSINVSLSLKVIFNN